MSKGGNLVCLGDFNW